MSKLNNIFTDILAAFFKLFATVMVKIQPIWDKYKITISLVLGLAIGLVLAWGPFAASWYNASPGSLHPIYRSYYLAYVADDYMRLRDIDKVRGQLGLDLEKNKAIIWLAKPDQLVKDIQTAQNDGTYWHLTPDQKLGLQVLEQELDLIRGIEGEEETVSKTGSPWLTLLFFLLLVFIVVLLIFYLLKRMAARREIQQGGITTGAISGENVAMISEAPVFAEETEPPVKSFTTNYVLGDDYFDPSFSIEIGNDFLGECGIGISETIGTGDPKKVTAFEAWLFDKSDIRTVTTVLASQYASADPDLSAKLAPKGEIEILKVGAEIMLETTALRVRARVKELEYAQGNLPPNSFVQHLSIELQAWVKPESALPPV
ncbi:MAG: hypothetical protein JXA33_04485 [Anaerolineae bacterium]|nr:hypothetical protein [Anaerolineae bacterium]